ncbi:hypothetical protein ACFQ15_11115 [Sphingomonas hankookensis]|uniref:hypothetical protein n=1 Tax=Sphingomonas hankookensis TaxID=563996 RepID=UPI001F57EA57|nr:hypothetical protein [Sphingomonas hankookensis]
MRFAIALLAATIAVPAIAQPAAPISVEDRATLDRAAERGRLLAAYDRVAWLATDDLQPKLPDRRNRLAGWVVDGPASGPTAIFYDRAQPPRGLYSARLVGGKLVDTRVLSGDAAILSPERLKLIAARAAASRALAAAKAPVCNGTFNTVVVPPAAAGDATMVYFLAPQKQANDMPIGGHFRVAVAADGTAGTPFAFSKGCMTFPPPSPQQRGAIGVVSTLTGPLPNETHSFAVEAYRRPLYVVVPGPPSRMFELEPGKPIRPVAPPAEGKKAS